MAIKKITLEQINNIKRRSVLTTPNNARERGLSPKDIKGAIIDPVLMVVDLVNEKIEEMNEGGLISDKPLITYVIEEKISD